MIDQDFFIKLYSLSIFKFLFYDISALLLSYLNSKYDSVF